MEQALVQGSPPRVRGKAIYGLDGSSNRGITPARAGKSFAVFLKLVHARDHPRACGEKILEICRKFNVSGSPPRVRGKVECYGHVRVCCGITPARAGKRDSTFSLLSIYRDHPRACGEKTPMLLAIAAAAGSPPRVRGKVARRFALRHHLGITPARAGKRLRLTHSMPTTRDHPRACGEKSRNWLFSASRSGSPPRVRGKAQGWRLCRQGQGITPARAGKSAPVKLLDELA